ncbi:YdeI/OmpD-associated family protein [Sphingopyxis sp. PET50]|uniref:YdeI/OmpD-associated family protein n=1 Tax=Sphingopyxis sp. PET50 TaxID=2976533 RepID=UPI0028A8BA5C|nr:YdeI/OmpD-associated family protein [Sphingopyxis sp. PET50]
MAANPAARKTWGGFAPSHRREYCEWVAEAKREETRDKRVAQAILWIAEGKDRNWKYKSC